jgi:outer membrane usher protein
MPPPGAFLNYSLFGSHASGTTVTDAYTELGLFNSWGILTDSYLGNDLSGVNKQWLRLETTFTQDHPDDIATLRAGDTITNGGMTGLATRFGGLQYATNFATQPGLATLPLPSIGAAAALPSTVQLYVNGVLQRTQDVQPGPFTVPEIPIASGPGLITLVVRDAAGHQQVINVPFYGANSLLAKGLDDYSFSLGKQRQNFGLVSNDYGPMLGSALFRRGFSDSFTGEVRGEAAPGQQVFGLGTLFAASTYGVFNVAVAESHSSLGQGTLGQFGYQYLGTTFSGGFNLQRASPRFTQSGYPPGTPAPRTQASASASMFLGDAGSMSVSYVHQQDPILGEIKLASLNYAKSLGDAGFLSFNLIHDLTGQNGNTEFLSLTIPLGAQRSASLGISHQTGNTTPFAQLQQSLPAGTGYGYRVAAQTGTNAQSQGELDYQNDVGTYDVLAQHSSGQTLYQAGVNGALGYLGGDFFASRQLTDAFAVVQIPDQANVDIYAQNQVVGRTGSHGYAVIPRLNAYQNNPIGYDPRNLPLDTDITSANMNVVPAYRSGLLVSFPVKTVRGVTFTVKLKSGEALPAGALIEVPGQGQAFPVGYDGEAYVTGLSGKARLKASWGDESCEFTVTVPTDSKDPIPDLGVYTCEAKHP